MGTVSGSAFHGPGTAAPAKAFSITLQNCPAGFSTIQYTIHPTNPILDPINAVIGLLQGGATGVGLQLLDGQNNPVPLNRAVTVPGYTPGSSTVDIPLQAAYYQTAPAITSGRADAAVDFTITYE
jgi:major type 1 subunit fimbrin (pilin)